MIHPITIDGQTRDIDIRPMNEDFILWRCLHFGPMSASNIDQYPEPTAQWRSYRARNLAILTKLIRTYGTCAILAWDGDEVVGFLRFYPKAVAKLAEAGGMCMQGPWEPASPSSGPSDSLVDAEFPPLQQIADKTLAVHCLMTGSPFRDSPYQRKGLGSAMARYLIQWATEHGWSAIEARSVQDIEILYQNLGQAGRRFWEKLGFITVGTRTSPHLQGKGEFFDTLRQQALALKLTPQEAANEYAMRLELAQDRQSATPRL